MIQSPPRENRPTSRFQKYARDWSTFPADAALAFRLGGIREVWNTLAPRTVHRVIRTGRLVIFAQPLDRAPNIPPPAGVTISCIDGADCDQLCALVTQRELERFRALTAAGRHCLVAWRDSRPIGYGWVAERIGPDVTLVPLMMPTDAAYLWDLYVLPAERCNGIGSALASARCRLARGLGFREGWRMIEPANHASIQTLVRSGPGARVVGEMRYIKIGSRLNCRFTPAAQLHGNVS